jgi:hypothetical protein
MPILADDSNDRAEQIQALTQRLTLLVQSECADIDARRPPAADAAEERQRLAGLYRQEMSRIAQDPSRLAGLRPPQRAALQHATRSLTQALEIHALKVGALKEVTEGLVEAIAQEVARAQRPATYDNSGYRARGAATASVAVNQQA